MNLQIYLFFFLFFFFEIDKRRFDDERIVVRR